MTDDEKRTTYRAALTPDENLTVGMIGGTVETMVLMPIITYKFCKQEGRPYPRFPGMYRGIAVQAGSVAPLTAIQMVFNGVFENAIRAMKSPTSDSGGNLSDAQVIACGLGAGAASAVLYGPVDLIMIHQQKQKLNPLQTVRYLQQTFGMTSIFRGLPPTALREALYTSGYLGLVPVFTRRIMQMEGWEDRYFASSLLGATMAGIISNLASHPVDTIKTVQQADMEKKTYRNSIQTFYRLLKENGVKNLFKGGFARTVRGCGAFFIVSSVREVSIQNKTRSGSPWQFT